MRGRWARPLVLAAALLLSGACALPGVGSTPVAKVSRSIPSPTPTPSPSPSPTAPLTVAAPSFKVAEVAAAYPATAFSAAGGVKPYEWTVSSGALPDGLNLGTDGSLNGTPTNPGTFKFTVQVADAGSSTAAAPGSILVRPSVTASFIAACGATCNVEQGCVNVCGGFGTVGGGVGPYTYSIVSGAPPVGTSLAPNALTLKGTFTASGNAQFTAMVTDGYGETATLDPDFLVYPHIAVATGPYLCSGTYLTACTVSFSYTGGVPGTNVSATIVAVGAYCPTGTFCPTPPTSPPGGLAITASNGTLTVSVKPACGGGCGGGYEGALSIRLTDQDPCAVNTYCQSGVTVVDVYMQAG